MPADKFAIQASPLPKDEVATGYVPRGPPTFPFAHRCCIGCGHRRLDRPTMYQASTKKIVVN